MSAQLEPRSYSERELTLRAISITSRRARAAQQRLMVLRNASTTPDPAQKGNDPSPALDNDLAPYDLGDDDALDDEDGDAALPNPMVTDGLLRHYLEQATLHQGQGQGGWRGLIGRSLTPPRLRHQAVFNSMIVHALHQLDHRSRLQQLTLAELEAETAAIRRALSDLESRFHQPS